MRVLSVLLVLTAWMVGSTSADPLLFHRGSGVPNPLQELNVDRSESKRAAISDLQGFAEDTRTSPVLVFSFGDWTPEHNMGIASDGEHYYTISGGGDGYGQINTYDLNGNYIRHSVTWLDARAIFYSPATQLLYVKAYDAALFRVDPVTGDTHAVFWSMFDYWQSSPAMTPDGRTILECQNGSVRFLDLETGEFIREVNGLNHGGFPSSEAIGTDGGRIFTWDGSHVYVYDMDGNPIEDYTLPYGTYGFSLKYVNGMLFAVDDGAGYRGTWYGYDVGGNPNGACCLSDGSCVILDELLCHAEQGAYQGDGTTCDPNPCHPTPSRPTTWGRIKGGYR